MIAPRKLKKGDKIGIISTARKISYEEILPAINILNEWGLEIVFGESLFKEYYQFSGNIEQRTLDLQLMLNDKNIKAILCARGGYGTVQIVDKIDFKIFKKSPKWIIGYSDVTVLHSHINNFGIATMHSTMPINFPNNTSKSLISLKESLFNNHITYQIDPEINNKIGDIEAELVGGNLSIIYSLLGSPSQLKTKNKILFIEDVDEYLYHIDRMVINLKRNNIFSNIKGLIVGSMTEMNDNHIPFGKTTTEIISSYMSEYTFPICYNFPSGHLNDNRSLVLGANTKLSIQKNGVILEQKY
tara:strand:+ start:267 stop:1166 length:900 start_codon:yes stop_codon:yes gene_type:complete